MRAAWTAGRAGPDRRRDAGHGSPCRAARAERLQAAVVAAVHRILPLHPVLLDLHGRRDPRARRRCAASGWAPGGSCGVIRSVVTGSIRFRRLEPEIHGKARSSRRLSLVPGAVRVPGAVPGAEAAAGAEGAGASAASSAAAAAPATSRRVAATCTAPGARRLRAAGSAADAPAALVAEAAERTVTVDTASVTAVFTNRGAQILSWRLKHYRDDHGKPVDLVPAGLPPARPGRSRCGRKTRRLRHG